MTTSYKQKSYSSYILAGLSTAELNNDLRGQFFESHYGPHYKNTWDISITTAVVANIGENRRTSSLPKKISAPEEGRSRNDSPTDSQKKSLIKLGHVSEIEDVNFQHVTDTGETHARFFKFTTSSNGLERLITQLYKIKENLTEDG